AGVQREGGNDQRETGNDQGVSGNAPAFAGVQREGGNDQRETGNDQREIGNASVFAGVTNDLRTPPVVIPAQAGIQTTASASPRVREDGSNKLGVFWHTQGSGKSISMIFLAQKVLRKIPGNWTFVIITDRKELDKQIYDNFVHTGAVSETQTQADSSAHLRQLLMEDHRYVFTLIHKFRTETGEKHPVLSTRSDIIVITDEAHRTQYDTLALNMRTALPNASFIAFTGTPLIVGEEKTRLVFGDYISIYNFKQSVDDKATVPLYYENRIPELQLTNENLNEDMQQMLEEAELDEEQEKKLEREFSREYHLITRKDRLETIARDIVVHFINRGFRGKAMVVCIDKATAVKMYDTVKKHWKAYIPVLQQELARETDETKQAELSDKLCYMRETDMAVVVSQAQNEIDEMRKKGLDILPHRKRMVKEDLDTKFKDSEDKFRLVFVCAMWMTGFDAPACSTIYLDKPMRNHTLMQTIARANRVFRDKVNGLIVDYVGVFRDLQKALAIYGSG
ncbi:MAG: HsdR family type I site-specific deoxyribonuclease, partial [bacterium]|nr:HsdR family type I site-specific deoxyribonuclease [bacterium]